MKTLDLDIKTHEFYLGVTKYFYTFSENDKKYYLEEIKNFDLKKFDTSKLIEIFKNLLKRENILNIKYISENDICGLFNFFNSIFL